MFLLLSLSAKIYLDNAATSFCDEEVLATMTHTYRQKWGNPNAQHTPGRKARLAILHAEEILQEHTKGIAVLWTSGATEANNIAILSPAHTGTTITCATEHSSVLAPVQTLSNKIIIGVNKAGIIDMTALKQRIKGARLVSIMLVNNETGALQPIAAIGALCRQHNVLFHVDAAAGFGKMPIDMKALGIDMLTISGHKIYGPQGVGALILSEKGLAALKTSLMFGGASQHGIRPGTLPTVLCAGMGKAAELAHKRMTKNHNHVAKEKKKFWATLQKQFPLATQNAETSWPYIMSVNIPKQDKRNLALILAKKYVFSAGSACSTGKPSHVLVAMGVDTVKADNFRFSFSR